MSQRRACRLAGQHRSTHRLATPARPGEEARLRAELRRIAGAHPRWGWRMAHALLRRDSAGPWSTVNHKRVQRLRREEGLRRPVRTRKRRRVRPDTAERLQASTQNVIIIDLAMLRPNQNRRIRHID